MPRNQLRFNALTTRQDVAALIDHFGVLGAATRPLDLSRMLGIALLLAGIWLTIR